MSKQEYLPVAWLPELLHTAAQKARSLVETGKLGPVFQPNPVAHRGREILVTAVERHLGHEVSESELADAARRYADRQRRQNGFTLRYRAQRASAAAAGDPDAALKLAAQRARDAEKARARRAKAK